MTWIGRLRSLPFSSAAFIVFDQASSLHFDCYAFGRDGDIILGKELTWGDGVYPVKANLKSSMVQDIFKFSCLWSFHRDEKVELEISAGLHTMRLSVNPDDNLLGLNGYQTYRY